jgi:hypothetical protein
MVSSAEEYYQTFLHAIGPSSVAEWENDILSAEHIRLTDRTAMDIIGARKPNNDTAVQEGTHPPNPSVDSAVRWVRLGIEIEATQ